MEASQPQSPVWHGTTILTVRKGGKVVIGGDGQVSIGQTVIKSNAKKVRKLGKGDVIGGFAGATADAFTLFERLESKLEQYPGQLTRAAVELAKDWRTDRYLRRLEAMMIVADKDVSLVLTGTGDVLEPEAGVMAIGSGGNYALAAARALVDSDKDAETIVRRSLDIAAGNPFAYLQCYDLTAWNSGFGSHPPGTRGIDLFIGEPDMIERGHGSALVRCFVDDRLQKGAPRIVTDPDPANGRAVRAYEKAGFEKDRMVETPDGPALLMIRNP